MTLRGCALVSLLLAVAALPVAAVDPALMKLVPPDAKVVAGIDVEQARVSPLGQYVLKQVPLDDQGMRNLVESTGFDPRRDLREILVASADGPQAAQGKGIVLAAGTFDPGRIVAAAKLVGATVTDYSGVEMLGGKEKQHPSLAFLSSSLVVLGGTDEVKAVIDRYKQGGAGPSATISAKAAQWSGRADAWFVSAGSPADWARRQKAPEAAGPVQAVPLEAIEQASGGVKFGTVVKISVEAVTRTDKDAAALGDVVRFLAGMVQLNRNKPGADQAAALMDSMELKTDSRTVTVGFSFPEEQLEKMIQSGPGKKRTAPAVKKTTTI